MKLFIPAARHVSGKFHAVGVVGINRKCNRAAIGLNIKSCNFALVLREIFVALTNVAVAIVHGPKLIFGAENFKSSKIGHNLFPMWRGMALADNPFYGRLNYM